jgi:hypothetical protein
MKDACRVGIHDTCHGSLYMAFTSDVRAYAVFDPKSRLDTDAVPVETSFNARFDNVVVGQEVC